MVFRFAFRAEHGHLSFCDWVKVEPGFENGQKKRSPSGDLGRLGGRGAFGPLTFGSLAKGLHAPFDLNLS